ncbi:MAG: CBS domain-containing protein [Saprospiraceae bacterium]|nr:CBS domain-containing protein [Saprospiraceae bacterium]
MLNVKQLLAGKPHNRIWSVHSGQMVIEALELMADRNIGAVLVMDGEELLGIFSERDYARKGILQGRKAKSTPITEVMTAGVFVVEPHHSIDDCMKLMSEKRIRHLPVLDQNRVIGLLSIGDIVTAIINEQKHRIQSLEHYITGAAY